MASDKEQKLDVLTPEIETAVTGRLLEAGRQCREEGYPLTYPNVIRTAITQGTIDPNSYGQPDFWIVNWPWNEDLLYTHIQSHADELRILLFSDEITTLLDIEPGLPTSHYFVEQIGYLFLTQLPHTVEKIKHAKAKPVFQRLDQCERGLVGLLTIDNHGLVVKFTLSDQETEIAVHLGNLGLAPRVYESTQDILVEEFIPDSPIKRYTHNPSFVGAAYGWILRKLHEQGIVYHNRMYDHILVGSTKNHRPIIRIIDLESVQWNQDFTSDISDARNEIESLFPDLNEQQSALQAFNR